jgi:hypothetical protein
MKAFLATHDGLHALNDSSLVGRVTWLDELFALRELSLSVCHLILNQTHLLCSPAE